MQSLETSLSAAKWHSYPHLLHHGQHVQRKGSELWAACGWQAAINAKTTKYTWYGHVHSGAGGALVVWPGMLVLNSSGIKAAEKPGLFSLRKWPTLIYKPSRGQHAAVWGRTQMITPCSFHHCQTDNPARQRLKGQSPFTWRMRYIYWQRSLERGKHHRHWSPQPHPWHV